MEQSITHADSSFFVVVSTRHIHQASNLQAKDGKIRPFIEKVVLAGGGRWSAASGLDAVDASTFFQLRVITEKMQDCLPVLPTGICEGIGERVESTAKGLLVNVIPSQVRRQRIRSCSSPSSDSPGPSKAVPAASISMEVRGWMAHHQCDHTRTQTARTNTRKAQPFHSSVPGHAK